MIRTANPTLNKKTFVGLKAYESENAMTIQGAPKYMEWYTAFGLMVILVWLYIEILRLLAKLADQR